MVNCDGADGGAVTSDENHTRFVEAGRQGQTLTLTIERAVFFRGDINQGPSLQPQPYPFVVGP